MGAVLGAWVPGKVGDDPDRYADGKGRRARSRREAHRKLYQTIYFCALPMQ
jgi:hypothetical protein